MKQFTMTLQKILPGSPKSCSSMSPRTAKYVSLILVGDYLLFVTAMEVVRGGMSESIGDKAVWL